MGRTPGGTHGEEPAEATVVATKRRLAPERETRADRLIAPPAP